MARLEVEKKNEVSFNTLKDESFPCYFVFQRALRLQMVADCRFKRAELSAVLWQFFQ